MKLRNRRTSDDYSFYVRDRQIVQGVKRETIVSLKVIYKVLINNFYIKM